MIGWSKGYRRWWDKAIGVAIILCVIVIAGLLVSMALGREEIATCSECIEYRCPTCSELCGFGEE